MQILDAIKLSSAIGTSAWIRRRPFLLYFKPTSRCDLRCGICNRWKTPAEGEELPLDDIKAFLGKFRRAGSAVLTLWGGEPLLRRDLPDILEEAGRLGFRTSMCTNCNQLAKKAGDVVPRLDVLLCSIDGYGEVHDEMRGVKGVFDRAMAGIRAAIDTRAPCDIKIWASIHRKNLAQIERIATLAKELSVAIEFFPVSPIPGYNDDLVPTDAEMRDACRTIIDLKRRGLPIRNPDRVLGMMQANKAFVCNFPRIAIHLDHGGRVYSCENPEGTPLHLWGGHAAFDPEAVYASAEFRRVTADLATCNRCRLPCVLELANSLPRALAGLFLKLT